MTPSATPPLDDFAAMAVFADLLSDAGDPRGELVQLQLELEQRPGDPRLVRAELAHLARHDRALLGGLRTATSLCRLRWRRGYIVEARLRSFAQDVEERWSAQRPPAEPKKARLPRVVRELLSLPSAQPLSLLTVELPYSSFARAHLMACVDEVLLAPTAELRVLNVHLLEPGHGWDGPPGWQVTETLQQQVGELHVSVDAGIAAQVFARLG